MDNIDKIDNIGGYLKHLREEQKMPAAQIAQVLKTTAQIISWIENNEFEKLPAPTYAKGYLRSYAKYLGIDPDRIIAAYNRQYPAVSKQVLVLEGKKLPRIGTDIKKALMPVLLVSAGIILAVSVFISLFVFFRHAGIKGKQPAGISPAAAAAEKKGTAAGHTPLRSEQHISAPFTLSAAPEGRAWLRLSCDGKLIFQGTLNKGDKESWKAQKEIKMRIGSPGKLNLTLNGRMLGHIAPYGPVNVTINNEGINIEK